MDRTGDLRIDEIMPRLDEKWMRIPFEECLLATESSYRKLKKKEFHPTGIIPVVDQGEDFIAGYTNKVSNKYPGPLPVVIFGDHTRRVKYVEFEFAVGADGVKLLHPCAALDPKFFFYYLRALKLDSQGYSRHYRFLKEIDVPVPPLDEQRRMVAKLEKLLSRVDAAKARLATIPSILKRFRQSVLAAACSGRLTADWRGENSNIESASGYLAAIINARRLKWEETQLERMLGNGKALKNDNWKRKYVEPLAADISELHELPEGWVWGTWNEVSNWVTYGFTRPMPHSPEGIPIVTAKHVVKRRILFDDADKTTEAAFANLSDKDRPGAGDILITKDGSIGRAALVETNRAFCINQSVAVVWLRSLTLNKKYLLAVVEAPFTQDRILEKARGAAIQHLSITDFAKMPVPIPPDAEQQEIVRRVEALFETADALEARYRKAKAHVDKLTQSILAKAFRGELVPQDPNDEPASDLLKRILRESQEKASQKGDKPKRRRNAAVS